MRSKIMHMKKIISAFLAICLTFCFITAPANMWEVKADTIKSGDYEYDVLQDGTVVIVKYTGNEAKITIPAEIDGKDVSELGVEAFKGKGMTEVVISDGIKSIGMATFSKCVNLQNVIIPNSVTGIAIGAFSECISLTEVTIPDSVSVFMDFVFSGCSNLSIVHIPDSIVITHVAFSDCGVKKVYYSGTEEQWDKIKNISSEKELLRATIYFSDGTIRDGSVGDYDYHQLSDGTIEITGYTGTDQILNIPSAIEGKTVTSIGEYAFNGCAGITEIIIPDSVTTVKPYAFYRSSAAKITIPASVSSIGQNAFSGCAALTEIIVETGAASPNYCSDDGVLYNKDKTLLITCPAGKTGIYTIPSGVTNINDYAFFGCTGITEITIPSSVISIQEGAFNGCSGLQQITVPASVTSIGSMAFASCSSLTDITIPSSVNNMGISVFSDCTGLKTATIQFNVTSIQSGTFYNCSSLESITIPSSITTIGQEAFENCENLKTVTIPTSVTIVQESAFGNCTNLSDVYYAGSEEQWRAIQVSTTVGGDAGNQKLLNATIHLKNGTTINGPEKNADYKIGTISAFDEAAKTVKIAGNIYAAADSLNYSGMNELVTAKEQIIATFSNGKITKIEKVQDVLEPEFKIGATPGSGPIILQNSGYLISSQEFFAQLRVTSAYPESAFQGIDGIGIDVSEIAVALDTEGFCIRREGEDRDETTVSITEPVNRKLLYGETESYNYVVYAKNGFTFTQEDLPYVIKANADTANGTASDQITMHAYFQFTEEEINLENVKQELDNLKKKDLLSLKQDFQNYLSDEQIDIIENYIYTWLAEVNYAYKYNGNNDVKKLIMKKAGLDPAAEIASDMEQAITHITVDTKYGKKNIEITLELGQPDAQGNLYPSYGKMNYEILEKQTIPEGLPVTGQIGNASFTDIGTFTECVARANEDSLHHTYQWESLQDDLMAGVLIDKPIIGMVGEQNGSFSDGTFTVYAKPLFTYSKKVTIACPVDVYIYTMDGKEVASIINNMPSDNARSANDPNVRVDVNGDTKTVYLTGNDYYVKLHGTDTGTMRYEVEEIANEEVRRNVRFLELQLKKDMQYEGYVFRPLNIDKDLYALRTVEGGDVFYADKDSYEALFRRILGLTLSQSSTSLSANKTVQLSASLFPLDASNPNLQWSTDNASVAKVDSSGMVTAVAAGKATITVATKDGSFLKQFCVIDVAASGGSSGSSSGGYYGGSSGGSIPAVEPTPVVVKLHYVVQFDANGGVNLSRKSMTLLEDDSPGIMPKVQRKDYTFDGWYTQQEGGAQVTGDKPLKEAATLYARWTKTAAPAKASVSALKSQKKGQMQVSFQKLKSAAGYEVSYSTSKSFASAKTKEAGAAASLKTITGLKAGKKYYVRVRAYCMDSMKNRIYGAYSSAKSIKIKS